MEDSTNKPVAVLLADSRGVTQGKD